MNRRGERFWRCLAAILFIIVAFGILITGTVAPIHPFWNVVISIAGFVGLMFGGELLTFLINSRRFQKENSPKIYRCENCQVNWAETALKRQYHYRRDITCPNCGEQMLEIISPA